MTFMKISFSALCPLFPLSFVSVCRMGQESTAAVVVSVGSAFPRLTTAYFFKSTESCAETKPPKSVWNKILAIREI